MEREAQALRRRGCAASPILQVMSKEMGMTTTTAAQCISTTARDERTSRSATSSTDEAARMPRGGGHASSTSKAKLADLNKVGKNC